MNKNQRVYYNIHKATLNGIPIHGLNNEKFTMATNFYLSQCFCSCCPFYPTEEMEQEYSLPVQVLYDLCGNAEGKLLIRYLTKDEEQIYTRKSNARTTKGTSSGSTT